MNTIRLVTRFVAASILMGAAAVAHAQSTQMLHSTPTGTTRDNYNGDVGCVFQVGSSNVIVSHIGVFNADTNNGLAASHIAGIFDASRQLLGQVTVPAGTGPYLTNGFRWVPLDPPILLSSNASYYVMGSVGNGDGDGWQDAFSPTWNTVFVGSTATTSRHAIYGPGNVGWPPASFSQNGNNNSYGNVSLANIAIDVARVGVQTTNVAVSAGQTISVLGFASGQQPISYQWYSAPNTPLPDQTNALLSIPNSAVADSGTYYMIASNSLGFEQSSNVTVLVTSIPVSITNQPTNLTVYASYPATFYVGAAGSPPITYQWIRNGTPISGATKTSYTISASSLTNNGDVYSCVASNYTSGTAYTEQSANATLTVIANLAQPQEFLHGARANTATNNFGGLVGGRFTVGSSNVLVTHLGYYASQFTDGTKTTGILTLDHHVGIFSADGSTLYASVVVPAGNNPVANGYMWTALNPPMVLTNGATYLLLAEVFSGTPTPDPWGDAYSVPDWNPYFLGSNTGSATYWGSVWPNGGAAGFFSGQMYSAPNLAILALPTPSAYVVPASVTQYAGLSASFTAAVDGQAPLVLQWYKEPGTPLPGQTNLTLTFNNPTLSDSGNYYVIATNPVTSATVQSADSTLTVIPDVGPTVTNDIQSVNAYAYQTVQFSIGATGTPPLSYQWTLNNNAIAGATNSTLTLNNVGAGSVGNYQVTITNPYGSTSSSVAALSVATPLWGGYASGVMTTNLLFYYRFSDVSNYLNGLGNVALNQGSLGASANGTYEGSFTALIGPDINDLDEPTNPAISMDGYDTDVLIPSQNVTVTNCTIAAWVYEQNDPQNPDAAIFYHRQSGGSVFGLSVSADANNLDQLRATWTGFHDTGLELPLNQWTFVAMSVTPTNLTVYMNSGSGLQSTNFTVANSPASFSGVSYVGYDLQASGRRWTGGIDELMVFKQALSPASINSLYLGVPQSATLKLSPAAGGNLTISWPGGTLQEATSLSGPWTPAVGAANGVYTVTPSGAMKFYRVKLQ